MQLSPNRSEQVAEPWLDSSRSGTSLTILTVVIEKHYPYVFEQLELISALNPDRDFRMMVVDNTSMEEPGLRVDDDRCVVVSGIDTKDLPKGEARGSYHHAGALNSVIRQVDTRYVLVLDPDLFVVYRNWIAECLEHMRRRNLAFFGTPWHSRWYRKWRGFPCVHFLLIDLNKVDKGRLDFMPAIVEDRRRENSAFHRLLQRMVPRFYNRWLIESRRDTGWDLNRQFGNDGRYQVELVLPVVDFDRELNKPEYLLTQTARRIEPKLPRRWSFFPAAGTFVRPSQAPGFKRAGIGRLNPERFAWRGAPFAFHMRRNVRDTGRVKQQPEGEQGALTEALQRVAECGSWLEWTA